MQFQFKKNSKGFLIFLLLITSCSKEVTTPAESTATPEILTPKEEAPVARTAVSFKTLSETIFKVSCHPCHSSENHAGSLDLSSYDSLMKSGMVVAKSPGKSKLFREVMSGRMPKGDTKKLEISQVQAVHDWIKDGALNN